MKDFDNEKFKEYCNKQVCDKCKLNRDGVQCRRLAIAYKAISYTETPISYIRALLEMVYDTPMQVWDEQDSTYEETKYQLAEYEKWCIDKAIGILTDAE